MKTTETIQQTSHLSMPQRRNVHGKIFGGYLMRKAFELAWMNCYSVTHVRPELREVLLQNRVMSLFVVVVYTQVDHVTFKTPVEVGNILELSSRIVRCEQACDSSDPQKGLASLSVQAKILNPATGQRSTSNTFEFLFGFTAKTKHCLRVVPESYADGIALLQAHRLLSSYKSDRNQRLLFAETVYTQPIQ